MPPTRTPPHPARRAKGGTDWSRATRRMPASFADQPVQGRREDDGLDLVEAVTTATALAVIAELAVGDEPAREEAVRVHPEDVVAATDEGADREHAGDDEDAAEDEED